MRILGLVAENYKRLRLVEIVPKGRVVKISGANGQGKTSVVDAFRTALAGKRQTQEMPVRKGAANAKLKVLLGKDKVEWVVRRTIAPNGTQQLVVESGKGVVQGRPQELLDTLQGSIAMDPTEFIRMKPKEQSEILRRVVKVDVDLEAINDANDADFEARKLVGREVKQIEGELAGMSVQQGLPAEKVDEAALLEEINSATQKNQHAMLVDKERNDLQEKSRQADARLVQTAEGIAAAERAIEELKRQLQQAEGHLEAKRGVHGLEEAESAAAAQAHRDAPMGEYVDASELTTKLREAQVVNREIDKRTRYEAVRARLDAKRREQDDLTRAIDDRTEKKVRALAEAKMPVEGLTFNESEVLYKGLPLEQLGEAEQIEISARIAMSENPELRVLPILHGEALDGHGLAAIQKLADEFDYQILMSMVDTSGKVGFVIEDGMVKTENDE